MRSLASDLATTLDSARFAEAQTAEAGAHGDDLLGRSNIQVGFKT
jgi:hypothetical protein